MLQMSTHKPQICTTCWAINIKYRLGNVFLVQPTKMQHIKDVVISTNEEKMFGSDLARQNEVNGLLQQGMQATQ